MNVTRARELLGVSVSSDLQGIKAAYNKRARVCHPDVNPDVRAQKVFVELTEAYRTLTSAVKKTVPPVAHAAPAPEKKFPERADTREKFSLPKETFLLDLTFANSYTGVNINLPGVNKYHPCTGKVPPGFKDGDVLRSPVVTGIPENYEIKVHVFGEKNYQRNGDDLIAPVTLSLKKALLGGVQEVVLPGGETCSANIPQGVQPGSTLKVSGKGFPKVPGSTVRGDLLLQVNIVLPVLTPQVQKFAEDLLPDM